MANPEVYAVYFPSWHPDKHYEAWYGPGFSEWELVKETPPLFPDHHQPLQCSWGCFDESDPAWMEKQVDLAADHGLTGFMFDWYWYNGERFLDAALEQGFLKSTNRHRLKYFVMWANHTWGVWPAAKDRYLGPVKDGEGADGQALVYDNTLLRAFHSNEDSAEAMAYCIDHYFHDENYLRINDEPVFAIWYPIELERQLGSFDAIEQMFAAMKAQAVKAGFPGLHITVNIANVEPGVLCWRPKLIGQLAAVGADSVYGYNVARTHGYQDLSDSWPVIPYDDVMQSHVELFRLCENQGLPFHPVATVGFDNTPRWHRGVELPVDFRNLGYEPIVVDNTPEKFEAVVRECLESIDRQNSDVPFVLINAWNEWTEGCYLLPEKRHGLGYLEAVQACLCD